MEKLKNLSLTELKDYKELLEIRIDELRRHQLDDEYYPPYTEKEVKQLHEMEERSIKALNAVKRIIRSKVDELIKDIKFE